MLFFFKTLMEKISKIGLWINLIHQLSDRLMESKLKAHDLEGFSATQGRVLFVLRDKTNRELSEKSIQDLVDELEIPNSSFTELIDSLVKKNLVRRVRSTSDRRKIHLQINEVQFNTFLGKYGMILREMTELYFHHISSKERSLVEMILPKIVESLKDAETQIYKN